MTVNHIAKKAQIASFNLTETVYPPGLRQPRHRHESASMSFVITGTYTENYGKKVRTCQPLTLVLHPPQESHAVDFHVEPVRILNVQFDFGYLARLDPNSSLLKFPFSRRSETVAGLGTRLFREFREPDEFSPMAVEALVLEILVETSRRNKTKQKPEIPCWLIRAKEILHDRFSEPLTLEEISGAVGVHRVHLARVFRRQFGCTIGEYLRILRVDFARRELSLTDVPLCEIALSAGFSDQSHFNKTFKKIFGLTPNKYRKFRRQS